MRKLRGLFMKKKFVFVLAILLFILSSCPNPPYTIKIENKSPYDCLCEILATSGNKKFLVKGNSITTKTTYYFIHLSDKSKRFYLEKNTIEHLIIKSKPKHKITVENKTSVKQTISSVDFNVSERAERLKFCLLPDITIEPGETKQIDVFYQLKDEFSKSVIYNKIPKNISDTEKEIYKFTVVKYMPNGDKLFIRNKEF